MPLIECPDCRKQISDSAPSCPICGRPSSARSAEPVPAGHQARTSSGSSRVAVESRGSPWVRFWARNIDAVIATVLLASVLLVMKPEDLPVDETGWAATSIMALFLWVFVETILMATVGTTPGKALLNVSVKTSTGTRLSATQALARSLRVWFTGLGIGFPLISPLTMLAASIRLRDHGITSWDERLKLTVTQDRIGTPRVLAAIGIFAGGVLLMILIPRAAVAPGAGFQRWYEELGYGSATIPNAPPVQSKLSLTGTWIGADNVRSYELTIQETGRLGDFTGYVEYLHPDGSPNPDADPRFETLVGSRLGATIVIKLPDHPNRTGLTFSGTFENATAIVGHWSVGGMLLAPMRFNRQSATPISDEDRDRSTRFGQSRATDHPGRVSARAARTQVITPPPWPVPQYPSYVPPLNTSQEEWNERMRRRRELIEELGRRP